MSSRRNFFVLTRLTGVRLVGHGDDKETQFGHDGTSGQEMANDEVYQCLQYGRGQVGGPQVPLLGHGSEIKSPIWACIDYRT